MATYYVKWDATGAGNGTSWADAYTSIQSALNARNSGNKFLISGGTDGHTYNEAITLTAPNQILEGSTDAGHFGRVTIRNSGLNAHAFYTGSTSNTGVQARRMNISNAVAGKRGLHTSSEGALFEDIGLDDALEYMLYIDQGCTFRRCYNYTHEGATVAPGVNKHRIRVSPGVATDVVSFELCVFYGMYSGVYLNNAIMNVRCCIIGGTQFYTFQLGVLLSQINIVNSYVDGAHDLATNVIYNQHSADAVNIQNSIILPSIANNTINATDGGGNIGATAPTDDILPQFALQNRLPFVVGIVLDDNEGLSVFESIAGKLEAHGWRGTMAVRTHEVVDWAPYRALVSRGHEISSHTRRHINLKDNRAFNLQKTGAVVVIGSNGRLTATGGVDIDLSLPKYTVMGGVSALITDLSALGFTAAAYAVAYSGNGSALNLQQGSYDVSTTVVVSYDDAKTYIDEVVGSKADIETGIGGGYVCKTLVCPGDQTGPVAQQWVLSAGYVGARGSVESEKTFHVGVDICAIHNNTVDSFFGNYSGVGSPWRQYTSAIASKIAYWGHIGAVLTTYTHDYNTWPEQNWNNYIQILSVSGATVLPLCEIVNYVQQHGTTADGRVYVSLQGNNDVDYHLIPTSPCIGTGVDVGLTTDADGNAVPGAVGYDIGPYSYMSGWTPFNSTMPALALSPTAPGKLKQVQTWRKADVTAEQINKYL